MEASKNESFVRLMQQLRRERDMAEARVADLTTTIQVLKALEASSGESVTDRMAHSGPYAHLPIKQSILAIFQHHFGEPLTNHAVREELESGGWHTRSDRPHHMVNRAIRSLRENGEVVQVRRGLHVLAMRDHEGERTTTTPPPWDLEMQEEDESWMGC